MCWQLSRARKLNDASLPAAREALALTLVDAIESSAAGSNSGEEEDESERGGEYVQGERQDEAGHLGCIPSEEAIFN